MKRAHHSGEEDDISPKDQQQHHQLDESMEQEEDNSKDLKLAVWALAEHYHHPDQLVDMKKQILDNALYSEDKGRIVLEAVLFCLTTSYLPEIYPDLVKELMGSTMSELVKEQIKNYLEEYLVNPEKCIKGLQLWSLLTSIGIVSASSLMLNYVARLIAVCPPDQIYHLAVHLLNILPQSTQSMQLDEFFAHISCPVEWSKIFSNEPELLSLQELWKLACSTNSNTLPVNDTMIILDDSILALPSIQFSSIIYHRPFPFAIHDNVSTASAYEQWRMYHRLYAILDTFMRRDHRKAIEYLHLGAAFHLENDEHLSVRSVQNVLFTELFSSSPLSPHSSSSLPISSLLIGPAILLIDGCRHCKAFAPALAQAMLSLTAESCMSLINEYRAVINLARWFSLHLSHFDYKWPWNQWNPTSSNDTNSSMEAWNTCVGAKVFFIEFMQYSLRLSYHDHLSNVLPEFLHSLLPPMPKPTIDVSSDDPVLQAIRSKQAVSQNFLDEKGPDHLLKCVLIAGSKTISHANSVIERNLPTLKLLKESAALSSELLLDVTFAFWRYHSQNFEIAVERYVRLELLNSNDFSNWFINTLKSAWTSFSPEELIRRLLRVEFISYLTTSHRHELLSALQTAIVDVEVQQLVQFFLTEGRSSP